MLTSHVAVSIQILAYPLLIQHPSNVTGKEVDDGLDTWVPVTHIGDRNGVPGSDTGLAQLLWPFWKNEPVDERSPSFSVPPFDTLPFK